MLDHDKDGYPIKWNATDQLRRQRKALKDAILAVLLLILLCCALVVWGAHADNLFSPDSEKTLDSTSDLSEQ